MPQTTVIRFKLWSFDKASEEEWYAICEKEALGYRVCWDCGVPLPKDAELANRTGCFDCGGRRQDLQDGAP